MSFPWGKNLPQRQIPRRSRDLSPVVGPALASDPAVGAAGAGPGPQSSREFLEHPCCACWWLPLPRFPLGFRRRGPRDRVRKPGNEPPVGCLHFAGFAPSSLRGKVVSVSRRRFPCRISRFLLGIGVVPALVFCIQHGDTPRTRIEFPGRAEYRARASFRRSVHRLPCSWVDARRSSVEGLNQVRGESAFGPLAVLWGTSSSAR